VNEFMQSKWRRDERSTGCADAPMRAKGPKRPNRRLNSLALPRSEQEVTVYALACAIKAAT